MLRYYFDEHLSDAIAEQLRTRGVDVVTAKEVGRANRTISDDEQLAFAHANGRVLVTKDRDYVMLAYSHIPNAGVILLQRDLSIGGFVEYLELAANCYEPDEMQNRLEFCEW